jgi:hypothetical protein
MVTSNDFKGLYIDPSWSLFENLLLLADVAAQKYEEEKSMTNETVRVKESELLMKQNRLKKPRILDSHGYSYEDHQNQNLNGASSSMQSQTCWVPHPPLSKNLKTKEQKRIGNPARKRRANQQAVPEPPPDIPMELKDIIMAKNGRDLKLVIQKKLYPSDLKDSYARLSIPKGQMRAEFLSEEDQMNLQQKEADGVRCKGLRVPLIEPCLEESTISLKRWKFGSSNSYILSSPWNQVVANNGLKCEDIIQLWSFKVGHKPCLALIKL